MAFSVINVLKKYHVEDKICFTIHPSGTKRKALFYFGVKKESLVQNEKSLREIKQLIMKRVNKSIAVSI